MWICISHATASPIIANATRGGMQPQAEPGIASKKPRKNTIAGARMYERVDHVRRELERPRNRQEPAPDQPARRAAAAARQAYHASAQSAANDSRFSSTNGDSGIAQQPQRQADQQRLQRARESRCGSRPRRGRRTARRRWRSSGSRGGRSGSRPRRRTRATARTAGGTRKQAARISAHAQRVMPGFIVLIEPQAPGLAKAWRGDEKTVAAVFGTARASIISRCPRPRPLRSC